MCVALVYCCDKLHDQKQLEAEKFTSIHSYSLSRKGNQGRNSKQESEDRNQSRDVREMFISGFLPVACSICFCINPKTTCPRLEPPRLGQDLLYQSLINKMPYRQALQAIYNGGIFSTGVSSSQITISFDMLTTTKSTRVIPFIFHNFTITKLLTNGGYQIKFCFYHQTITH